MIGNIYKVHRDNVIDLYDRYIQKRGDQDDGVKQAFLGERVRLLKERKYTLVIAGEVKAGKSTFINALLEAEILPSDVLQTTSAIVEIFKSPQSFVKVTYADGHTKEQHNDPSTPFIDEANDVLRTACSIQDKYRDIPTVLLNKYIINGILEIPIGELEAHSKGNLRERMPLIQEYIAEYTLDKIPLAIQFGYPLKWEFDELRLVDSPGVNALGGVQDKTYEYIDSANAILFVHPIKPVESQSFRDFFEKVIRDRSRETLFLVLTHAGLYTDENVSKLHEEAQRLYAPDIPSERILVVDSLLKLIHLDLKSGKTVKEIKASSPEKAKLIPEFRERAEETGRDLIELIGETSRFDAMICAINDFSFKAPMLQLAEIVDSIRTGYNNLFSEYTEKVARLGIKKRNPQEFEDEICRIKDSLDLYKNLIFKKAESLKKEYTGQQANWKIKFDSLKLAIPENITNSKTEDQVRKHFADAYAAIDDIVDAFAKQITKNLKVEISKIGGKFKADHQITVPGIDLNYIEEIAKQDAYQPEKVYEDRERTIKEHRVWWNLWKFWKDDQIEKYRICVGENRVFNASKFLDGLKNKCNEAFYDRANKIAKHLPKLLNKYLETFESEVNDIIVARQNALEEEKHKKQKNAEILEEINQIERKKKDIITELERTEEIRGNLQ